MTLRLRSGPAALVVFWLVAGGVVANGAYDYIESRATREYLYRNAELRLGIEPPAGASADLRTVLAAERRKALRHAAAWWLFVTGSGWATVWVLSRR